MRGKVCLVTGATSGIGDCTALGLAHKKATVILVGRSEKKCIETVSRIQSETNNAQVGYLVCDLSSQTDIRRLVSEFKDQYSRLDVLVNNVGGAFWRRTLSEDGLEMTFALNHLSYFLLTNLLLDELNQGSGARVVNVSSGSHKRHRLDFNDLQLSKNYNVVEAYGQSKLANVLFTYELHRRLNSKSVTANVMSPGLVSTPIWKNSAPGLGPFLAWCIRLFAQTPQEGAEAVIYLASSPDVEGISGKYFRKKVMTKSAPQTYNIESAKRLWEISEQMTGLV